MTTYPENLYTAEQTRKLDQIAIEEFDIPASTLMARAADSVFETLSERYPKAKKIAVVTGLGNNAGDGFMLARLAQGLNYKVTVYHLGEADKYKDDCFDAYQRMQGTDVSIINYTSQDFKDCDVIIDGIFGIGLNREAGGLFKTAIEKINNSGKPTIAIDIPSGLNANTGTVWGVAIKANITISFIGLKQGLLTGEGPEYSGELLFDDLDVPKAVYDQVPTDTMHCSWENSKKLLQKRSRNAHKGNFGHSLLVGGDKGMGGAIQMAATAALRVGSGLVSVATHTEHAAAITAARPEIMCVGAESPKDLNDKLELATVIGLGPGLGKSKWAKKLYGAIMQTKLPLVIDADALNLLSEKPSRKENWILTPHPGEAGRLLNCTTQEIQSDRFLAIKEIQKKYGGVIVLKGAGSLICDGSKTYVCTDGNPGMASGGMGDVLTGILTGLIAQGFDLATSAKLGVCLHAAAGDQAAKDGERGLMASDVIASLKQFVNP